MNGFVKVRNRRGEIQLVPAHYLEQSALMAGFTPVDAASTAPTDPPTADPQTPDDDAPPSDQTPAAGDNQED